VGEPGTALRAGLVAVCIAALTALQLPAAGGAGSPSSLRDRAQQLRAENGALSTQARATWLSEVSLGTRLQQTQSALVRLRARTRSISLQRAEAQILLKSARHTLAFSQRQLANRLRVLYEQGNTDTMAVLVGSSSIDEAISRLENLHRIAGQDHRVIEEAKAARHRLLSATRLLTAKEAQARATEEATATSVAVLAAARRERQSMLASFAAQRSSNSATISTLESQARSLAVAESRAAVTALPGQIGSGRSLTVTATGYSLSGRTATGVPVGYGIVAVDPNVIPLGTHMTIPGYGAGVAADTGGAVVGARIDLWFPTRAEALAWGTRTVSITIS
jgi:3D (Asp-Asp-Asp) domain-containing protein/septal ring factor EnvC (AmiA/AmiB activator)